MTAFLDGLVGRTIPTLTGRPNHIFRVSGGVVYVATTRSPEGRPVEIAALQEASNQLCERGELVIEVATVGYRSACVGAVLSALPGTRALTRPGRVVLVRRTVTDEALGGPRRVALVGCVKSKRAGVHEARDL